MGNIQNNIMATGVRHQASGTRQFIRRIPSREGPGVGSLVNASLLIPVLFDLSKKKIYFCREFRSHSSMDRMEVS